MSKSILAGCRRSRSRRTLCFEEAEERIALSVNGITDYEQLIIELVNRARANPSGEAAIYGIGLNDNLDPGTISTDPKAPLAPHQALATSAGLFSDDMLARDFFSHTDPDELLPWDRAEAAGYPSSAGVGENIAWRTYSGTQEDAALSMHGQLFNSAGHRANMLNPSWNEVGVGTTFGLSPYQSISTPNIGVAIAAEVFGGRAGITYLTGIAFDDTDADGFYSVGEGLGGVTVTATDGLDNVFSTTTATAGGYALQLPAGTYTITADGNGVVAQDSATIGSVNVKIDFQPSSVPPPSSQAILVGRADGDWWVAISDGTSFTNELWGNWSTSVTWEDVMVGDFDGDGRDDVIGRASGDWWIARSTGNTFQTELWASWSSSVSWDDVLVADVDGDGKDDLVGRTNGQWWISRDDGTKVVTEYWGRWSNAVTWNDVMAADVDGDGNDDIVGRANGQWWISRSQGTFFTVEYWGQWSSSVTWEDVMVADVDGNGNDDIVGRVNGQWWVSRSQGTFFTVEYWGQWSSSVTWEDVMVADVDGDGSDDIVGRADGQWWVSRSLQSNFVIEYWGSWSTSVAWLDVFVVDIDGDGRDDILGRENGRWWVARSNNGALATGYLGAWSASVTWEDVHGGRFS